MTRTFRIAGTTGLVPVVACQADQGVQIVLRLIAAHRAESTARPAYREMIDTIRWEDVL